MKEYNIRTSPVEFLDILELQMDVVKRISGLFSDQNTASFNFSSAKEKRSFLDILELQMDEEVNCHGKMIISGHIADEQEEEYLGHAPVSIP